MRAVSSSHPSKPREIRNFLLAVAAGVAIAATVIGGVALRSHGKESMQVENLLLAPELMGDTAFVDRDPATRVEREWRFDRAELLAGDELCQLTDRAYQSLYTGLRLGKPIAPSPTAFEEPLRCLRLTLSPAGRYALSYEPRLFQQVQIAKSGDLFRVELLFAGEGERWAYFQLEDPLSEGLYE